VLKALRSEDNRRRDAASYFIIKNSVPSKRRGWSPSSSASVDLNVASKTPGGKIAPLPDKPPDQAVARAKPRRPGAPPYPFLKRPNED
jgi:hypothetical protein